MKKALTVKEKAPTRLSFANGGDTDYYIKLLGAGNCINATINLFARCEIRKRNDSKIVLTSKETKHRLVFSSLSEIHYGSRELNLMKAVAKHYGNTGIEVTTSTEAPLESGLGGSASHTVALIKAFDKFNGLKRSPDAVAKLAYHIERDVIKQSGGYQDQWAAAFTGINYMEFLPGEVKVHPLRINKKIMKELEKKTLLVYVKRKKTGHEVHDELKEKSSMRIDILRAKIDNVLSVKKTLETGRIEDFGSLVSRDWKMKRQLASCISNSVTDKIYEAAMEAGAFGGRFVGAGAGGCAFFICKNKKDVMKAVKKLGAKEIPFKFYSETKHR